MVSELNNKSKRELIRIISVLSAKNSHLSTIARNKQYVIDSYTSHLKRLRDRMDYIIMHPWSTKNGGFNSRTD